MQWKGGAGFGCGINNEVLSILSRKSIIPNLTLNCEVCPIHGPYPILTWCSSIDGCIQTLVSHTDTCLTYRHLSHIHTYLTYRHLSHIQTLISHTDPCLTYRHLSHIQILVSHTYTGLTYRHLSHIQTLVSHTDTCLSYRPLSHIQTLVSHTETCLTYRHLSHIDTCLTYIPLSHIQILVSHTDTCLTYRHLSHIVVLFSHTPHNWRWPMLISTFTILNRIPLTLCQNRILNRRKCDWECSKLISTMTILNCITLTLCQNSILNRCNHFFLFFFQYYMIEDGPGQYQPWPTSIAYPSLCVEIESPIDVIANEDGQGQYIDQEDPQPQLHRLRILFLMWLSIVIFFFIFFFTKSLCTS